MRIGRTLIYGVLLNAAIMIPAILLIVEARVPKVGVVRAQDLIGKNAMFKEQMDQWQNKESSVKANIVTLEEEISRQMNAYESDEPRLTEKEKSTRLQEIESKKQNYFTYVNSVKEQASEQQTELVEAVLGRINTVMNRYGEENGFDVILGSAGEGNILYGANTIDITEEVLEEFNREYYDQ